MAIACTADGQGLGRTDFPATSAFTCCVCWRTATQSTYQAQLFWGDFADYVVTAKIPPGSQPPGYGMESPSSSGNLGSSLSDNTWYGVAVVYDPSASPDDYHFYVYDSNFDLDDSLTLSTDTQIADGTFRILDSLPYTATESGTRAANGKAWSGRVLSAAEIARELKDYRVLSPSGIWGHWPMLGATATLAGRDWSGQGRNLSEVGTITLADGPPIPFSRRRAYAFSPAAAAAAPQVEAWMWRDVVTRRGRPHVTTYG